MTVSEARKELRKVGCSKAQGDALRYMYASLVAVQCNLTGKMDHIKWPIPQLYRHLQGVDDGSIATEARKLLDLDVGNIWDHVNLD